MSDDALFFITGVLLIGVILLVGWLLYRHDLKWEPVGIMVIYDPPTKQIRYIKASTGEVLKVWDVATERFVDGY